MKFRETIRHTLPADRVLSGYANPDFYPAKYAATNARDIRVLDTGHDGGRFHIRVSRKVPADIPVPAFARHWLPQEITLIQTDRWDRASGTGSVEIEFVGLPVRIDCGLMLAKTDGAMVETLDFEIRVDMPLVGGMLAKLLAEDLQLKFAKDTEATLALLPGFG
jgi:hypothetical protein